MPRHYARVWKRSLNLPDDVTPLTLVHRTAAAKVLGTTREHLRRLARNNSGPPWSRDFDGKGTMYQISDLVIFRARILGEGPTTLAGVWELWCNEERAIEELRTPPRPRGGRPLGVRQRHWHQQRRQRLRGLLLRAEMLCVLARVGRDDITAEWLPIIRAEN